MSGSMEMSHYGPIIDFDLTQEEIDSTIKKSRKTIYATLLKAFKDACSEIYTDWDPKTLTVATSDSPQKMSLHISTTGFRLANIGNVSAFINLVRNKLPKV